MGLQAYSQITFNACNALLENQDYTFNQISTDVTGRNVFETNPINGDNPCGGVGVCEFRINWNETFSRWEILADDGNGDFSNPHLLYYTTENTLPNPPSLNFGNWIENNNVTRSECGAINVLTGDVQDSTLSVSENQLSETIFIYPNPSSRFITIKGDKIGVEHLILYDLNGKRVIKTMNVNAPIDVSRLESGLYFAKIKYKEKVLMSKLIIQ